MLCAQARKFITALPLWALFIIFTEALNVLLFLSNNPVIQGCKAQFLSTCEMPADMNVSRELLVCVYDVDVAICI